MACDSMARDYGSIRGQLYDMAPGMRPRFVFDSYILGAADVSYVRGFINGNIPVILERIEIDSTPCQLHCATFGYCRSIDTMREILDKIDWLLCEKETECGDLLL